MEIDLPGHIVAPESLHTPQPPNRHIDLILLILAAGFLFFVSLGSRDLWNPNEPIYGRAVSEMAETENWLIPTVNGKVFAEKPILYFWAALASSKIVGEVNELSLRIPSALAGVASVFLTYLLVTPYLGRRRALITLALFVTLYQVFWASRSVQMDILVLASTLGVLLPLTRLLDFKMAPARAWALAGVAAGLGFTAKGPVTLILPGLVIFAYAISTGRLRSLLRPQALWGVAIAVLVSLPWYAVLWAKGENAFLYEVLIRQNFGRFVSAWDHQQPWWYFLKYIWLDYAPWSWLLPAAWLLPTQNLNEQRLHRLSWIWIVAMIFFFSLSDSKRAPYILPIAPAIAILAGCALHHWTARERHGKAARVATAMAFSAIAVVFLIAGIALMTPWLKIPAHLSSAARVVAAVLAASGLSAMVGLLAFRHRPRVPAGALFAGISMLYLLAAVWILPAVDTLKSARSFAGELNRRLQTPHSTVASYRFWDWRAGYSYYSQRSILNLKTPEQLTSFWAENTRAYIIVEGNHLEELRRVIPEAALVHESKIGGRTAFLFTGDPQLASASLPIGRQLPEKVAEISVRIGE